MCIRDRDSIVDLVKLHQNNKIDIFPKNIDIVTGGFPCQDFSIAGKRLGFESKMSHKGLLSDIDAPTAENRGTLYMWMREVIAITQPKIFIAENVKGLTNLGDTKAIIEADFASISDEGYFVFPAKTLHAADYGVPQSREPVSYTHLVSIIAKHMKSEAVHVAKEIKEHNPEAYDLSLIHICRVIFVI